MDFDVIWMEFQQLIWGYNYDMIKWWFNGDFMDFNEGLKDFIGHFMMI